MNGHTDVIQMEEDGEVVFNKDTGCYEPISQEWLEHQFDNEIDNEIDNQIAEEMQNDAIYEEEKERRAGFFDVHPNILQLLKDYKKQQEKIDKIDQKIKEIKNDNNR